MFRANFQRTGFYQTESVRQLREVKWKFRQSNNLSNTIPGRNYSLAVKDEILCVESSGGNVYGLNIQTGQQIWNFKLEKGTKNFSFSIVDSILYIGTRQFDNPIKDDYLWAINIFSGQLLWKFKLPSQSYSISFTSVFSFSSPVVVQDIVYIGGSDGNVYALNISSGEPIWSLKTTKNMALTSPAIKENILCIYSSDGYLYTIDLTTRQQK